MNGIGKNKKKKGKVVYFHHSTPIIKPSPNATLPLSVSSSFLNSSRTNDSNGEFINTHHPFKAKLLEVTKMEDEKNESHLTSPAAFVEGGIQEACDDSCSICLEAFCDNDPKTVTSCKHEFHLQCILEWCQRSSNCPMCWQAISLKDPSSQELLEAVERERRVRFNPPRNSTIFHHPTLGDFELQHLPVGVSGSELEDRIIQHLAAAAAMGRTHHVGRRDGSFPRNRVSMGQSRPQFLVFSANPNGPSSATMLVPGGQVQEQAEPVTEPAFVDSARAPSTFTIGRGGMVQRLTTSRMVNGSNSQHGISSSPDQNGAGPSEMQVGSDTWKSRFSTFSARYKESLSKSTRGWKDKLFNKTPSISNIGSEVRREDNTEIDNMSRMIERLDVSENSRQHHNHDDDDDNARECNRIRVETAGVSGSN